MERPQRNNLITTTVCFVTETGKKITIRTASEEINSDKAIELNRMVRKIERVEEELRVARGEFANMFQYELSQRNM